MDKIELELKRDEGTIFDNSEKLKLVPIKNMVTKEELSHNFVAKDVIENKMIFVAGQMCIEYEKKNR